MLKWHNETRKINQLIEWESNPRYIRKEQFEKLKGNIDKYNFTNPVLINTDNKIIAGHMRTRALKDLGRGEEEIPVRVPNRKLSAEEFRELAIRDNKNTGDWDFDVLANEFGVDDLIDWGFSEEELAIDLGSEVEEETETIKTITCPNCGMEIESNSNA